MLDNINVEDILFLDIETVPQESCFENVDPDLQKLWEKKSDYFRQEEQSAADVYGRAGIYAEFGKIVCISVGIISARGGRRIFRVKSFAGDNEKVLLEDFGQMLSHLARDIHKNMCGHNAQGIRLSVYCPPHVDQWS